MKLIFWHFSKYCFRYFGKYGVFGLYLTQPHNLVETKFLLIPRQINSDFFFSLIFVDFFTIITSQRICFASEVKLEPQHQRPNLHIKYLLICYFGSCNYYLIFICQNLSDLSDFCQIMKSATFGCVFPSSLVHVWPE